MKDILSEIIAHKRIEIEQQKQAVSLSQLQEQAAAMMQEAVGTGASGTTPVRSMKRALANSSSGIIAEFCLHNRSILHRIEYICPVTCSHLIKEIFPCCRHPSAYNYTFGINRTCNACYSSAKILCSPVYYTPGHNISCFCLIKYIFCSKCIFIILLKR